MLHHRALVVVDEAYVEFAGEKTGMAGGREGGREVAFPGRTAAELLGLYPNLVVLRTFSKAWPHS